MSTRDKEWIAALEKLSATKALAENGGAQKREVEAERDQLIVL